MMQDRPSDSNLKQHERTSPTKSIPGNRGSAVRHSSSLSPKKVGTRKGVSPEKGKGRAWNSLWSLDYSSEGGRGRG